MQNKKELIFGLIIKIIAVLASVYGLIRTTSGIMTFTYFTTLSNVAVDIILMVFIAADIRFLVSGGKTGIKTNTLYIIKFIMTISITLTFLVFMLILAPTQKNGFIQAYLSNHAASLCLHFITPVLAIVDFLLFDYNYKSTRLHTLYAIIPALVYLTFVTIAGYAGLRWGDGMYAPYNFINFGAPTGWFGFDLSLLSSSTLGIGVAYMVLLLVFIFLGIGAVFLKLKDLRRKHRLL